MSTTNPVDDFLEGFKEQTRCYTWDEIKGKAHLYKTARLRSTGEYVQLCRVVKFVDGLALTEPVFACRVQGMAGVEHRTTAELCDFCL